MNFPRQTAGPRRLVGPGKSAAFAALGALIGLTLTPFMAAVWAYEPGISWSENTLVERTFGPLLESAGLLTFGGAAPPEGDGLPYEVYGKGFFLVYLLMLPVVRATRPKTGKRGRVSQLAAWSWRGVYGAVWVATVADFISYWGKSVPGAAGDALWSGAGGIEILTLMFLLGSTIVFAVSAWRAEAVSAWVSATLAVAVIAVVPVNAFVTSYWPNSFVVPLSIGWAAIAAGRLSNGRKQTLRPGR